MIIEREVVKAGSIIEFTTAEMLYVLLLSIEQQYPNLLWQSKHTPTKWFPDRFHCSIRVVMEGNRKCLICHSSYHATEYDRLSCQWEDDRQLLIENCLIPPYNTPRP